MKTSVHLTRCPARFKYLALVLRGYIGQAGSQAARIPESGKSMAKDKGGAYSPKFPFLVGITAAGMALGIGPAAADVTCVGKGPSPEHPTYAVYGAATFNVTTVGNLTTLTLILKNSGPPTPAQGDALTGVLFNISGSPALSFDATTPKLVSGSDIYVSPTTTDNSLDFSKGWISNTTGTTSNYTYGLASTGWGGIFNGNAIPINKGPDYGVVAAGTFSSSGSNFNGSAQVFPYAQNALRFVFTSGTPFTEASISQVGFLFGTQGGSTPISCVQTDFGDAPDKLPGALADITGNNPPDYQTTYADNGPSHVIGNKLVYLGNNPPDGDDGTLQNDTATADNKTNVDDEDGVDLKNLPSLLTTTKSVTVNVSATNLNTTESKLDALLACWIDFNRDGVFGGPNGKGELATWTVPAGSGTGTYGLTFSGFTWPLPAGPTAMRCRISTDTTWKAKVTNAYPDYGQPGSIGPASDGEVEDYMVNGIYTPCQNMGVLSLQAVGGLNSGVQITLNATPPTMNDIKYVQCQKLINVNPLSFITPIPPPSGPTGTPSTWTFDPPVATTVFQARKTNQFASGTIACTATSSAGQTCSADPWFTTAVRLKGSGAEVSDSQLIPPVAKSDDYIKVTNGTPGVNKLEITVNGQKFNVNGLRDGEIRSLCVTSAMHDGDNNSVYVVAKGKPGGSAELYGEPNMCSR